MRLSVVLAGVVLFLLCRWGGAVGDAAGSEELRGIKAVGIEVEKLPRVAERLGIKQDSLKTEVASKLRSAGIAVPAEDECKLNPAISVLKVSLLISYSNPTYVYAVVLGLNEKVHVERAPEIISYAMPWWRIIRGEHVGEGDVARDVQETLRHIMNEFVADYEAANRALIDPAGIKSEQQDMFPGNGGEQGKEQREGDL